MKYTKKGNMIVIYVRIFKNIFCEIFKIFFYRPPLVAAYCNNLDPKSPPVPHCRGRIFFPKISLFIFFLKLKGSLLQKDTALPITEGNYMFHVKNRNTRTRCEICSKLTIKTRTTPLVSFWCLY